MGLFGRKPAAPQRAAAPPAKDDNPLHALAGLTVDESVYADGTLTLTFKGPSGEAHLEAYGKVLLKAPAGNYAPGTGNFDAGLKSMPGRKVMGATMVLREDLAVVLEDGLAVLASLRPGDYPGTSAVYLKGPGASYVNFHADGFTRLSL